FVPLFHPYRPTSEIGSKPENGETIRNYQHSVQLCYVNIVRLPARFALALHKNYTLPLVRQAISTVQRAKRPDGMPNVWYLAAYSSKLERCIRSLRSRYRNNCSVADANYFLCNAVH